MGSQDWLPGGGAISAEPERMSREAKRGGKERWVKHVRSRTTLNHWSLDFPYDQIRASETCPVLLMTP